MLFPCCVFFYFVVVCTEWTVSVIDSRGFLSQHTHTCDSVGCRFKQEKLICHKQIQCRHHCDPYTVFNGYVRCGSNFEGDSCSVNCNHLYILEGPSEIQCTSSGWSGFPYCIGEWMSTYLLLLLIWLMPLSKPNVKDTV